MTEAVEDEKIKEFPMETLKEDLVHQLIFEHMNWDYFVETAIRARDEANRLKENLTE